MALGDYKYILDSRPTGASRPSASGPNVKNRFSIHIAYRYAALLLGPFYWKFPSSHSIIMYIFSSSGLWLVILQSKKHWSYSTVRKYSKTLGNNQSPHRISYIGWLLFMRCMSFTFAGLFWRWTPVDTFEVLLAKLLSGCDSATCLTKCKARHSKICEILKKTCHFETNWMPCVLYWGVCSHVVSDAESTGTRCSFLIANDIKRSWHSPTKYISSSSIQTTKSIVFVEICA